MFAKTKPLLREAAERTETVTWRRIGTLLDAFSPAKWQTYSSAMRQHDFTTL